MSDRNSRQRQEGGDGAALELPAAHLPSQLSV
jgi:hypothetical protein